MKFSPSGIYLLTAGYQNIIYIWQIKFNFDSSNTKRSVIIETPFRCFTGHDVISYYYRQSEILEASWSKRNFIISCSVDSVRLWHVDRELCIASFVHTRQVNTVAFLASDDCYFLTGE